jgi:pSer/pThr/pTyr-binding forkhead associated (FHA) protein
VGQIARQHQRAPSELKDLIAAQRTGNPLFEWFDGGGRQRLLVLEQGRWRVTIGRDPAADVPLLWDPKVSRAHAVAERVGARWTLLDDGLSRNGSYVNDKRVIGRHLLADRDRLRFGNVEVTYHAQVSPQVDVTAGSVDKPPPRPLSPMQRKVLAALCRPLLDDPSASPATNLEITQQLSLTLDAVKAHLRVLFERYGLSDLPQNEKRIRLVAVVLEMGVVAEERSQ